MIRSIALTGWTPREMKITCRVALPEAFRADLAAAGLQLEVGSVGQVLVAARIRAQTVASFALIATGPTRRSRRRHGHGAARNKQTKACVGWYYYPLSTTLVREASRPVVFGGGWPA